MKTVFQPFTVAMMIGVFMAAPAQAAPRDPYIGEWGGDCGGQGAQCWIEIEKGEGNVYNVAFIAADRMNASKVLCRADIPMERGRLEFTAQEQYDDGLSGFYGKDPLVWILSFGGSISFYINDDRCGKFDMLGEYTAIGD